MVQLLPAYRVPENKLPNALAELGNSFMEIGKVNAINRGNEIKKQAGKLQAAGDTAGAMKVFNEQGWTDEANELQLRADQQEAAQEAKRSAYIKRVGGMADMIDREQDPVKKQQMWGRLVNHDPRFAKSMQESGFDLNDHINGPKLILAEIKGPVDKDQEELTRLKIQGAREDLSMAPVDRRYKEAQIESLNRKAEPDPIEQMLVERLRGGQRPAMPQAPQPAPLLQPQNFQGGQTMPGVQLIADEAAPAAPPQQDLPDANTIDTPFGRMSRDEARELAGPMLLSPKYSAAGRALMDSINQTAGGELSKPAATQLDERTISAASTLGRLQTIRQQFKPEFQQIPERLKIMGASWGAAFGGKLNPKMQTQLGDYATYRATAFDNFNQLLKELSGTAVSAQELARQKLVQPNPGEGLFDGDDPVTLMAKINQGEKIAKSAMARMNFMRSRGIQFNKDTAEQFLRLEDVPAAIDKRGAEIEQQLRQANPKASPQSLEMETAKRLKQEFGI